MAVLTVAKTQCCRCKRFFVGLGTFDAHFVGSGAFADNPRRCRTDAELLAAGLAFEQRLVRMRRENVKIREEHPVWYDVLQREEVRQAFSSH